MKLNLIRGIIHSLYKEYGVLFPFMIIFKYFKYIISLLFFPKSFVFNGKSYRYFKHMCNATFQKERAVEIGVVLDFIKQKEGKKILEIGNVMQYYYNFAHDIVDKYEVNKGVQNIDIIDFKPNKGFDLIISISTFEHIGWDETPKEPEKIKTAIEHTKTLLNTSGMMILTLPIGYNQYLDKLVKEKALGLTDAYYLKRLNNNNLWKQVNIEEFDYKPCNKDYVIAEELVIAYYVNKFS